MSWQDEGVCAQIDPDLWFPDKGHSAATPKRICRQWCPVQQECLTYALANPDLIGIWGGYTTRERRRMRQEETA